MKYQIAIIPTSRATRITTPSFNFSETRVGMSSVDIRSVSLVPNREIKISDIFGIPLITHKTKAAEREAILSAFRDGRYTKITTGHVLDEGVDVPDASVGIIISGSGSKREFIQRLGRLLRPQKEEAVLVEIITKATLEDGLARRRRQIGKTSK